MRRYFPSSVWSRYLLLPLVLALTAGLALGAAGGSPGDPTGGAATTASSGGRPLPVPGDPTLLAARAALRGGVGSPTLSLTRLALAYDRLSAAEQAQARVLLARPTDGAADPYLDGYAPAAPRRTRCTRHFCFHWVTTTKDAPPLRDADHDGRPDWVERIIRRAESVWSFEVGTLGYRRPPGDGRRGGDTRFDLYLADLGAQGVYGYCPAEKPVPGEDYLFSSYCVLDDDFAEYPLAPLPSFRVTLAHEFFHAIQYGYDAAEDPWLMEASATWMEEQFADAVNDNRQYLPFGQLGEPGVPLDQFPAGLAPYGNWAFVQRLSQEYGPRAVRAVWRRADARTGGRDEFATQAVDGFLRAHGSSLREFYAEFAVGNLAPDTVYEEGSVGDYPAAPVDHRVRLGPRHRTGQRVVALDHLTSTTLAVRPTRAVTGAWRLRLDLRLPGPGHGAGAVVVVELSDGSRVPRPVTLDRHGDATVRTGFDPGRVARVLVTLTNASLRFSCWQDSSFSCQGVSRDDKIKTYRVDATLRPPA